jgi:hypothetical protein
MYQRLPVLTVDLYNITVVEVYRLTTGLTHSRLFE